MPADQPGPPPTLLVVDDDAAVLRALQRELRDQPVRVDLESDPMAALDRIHTGGYNVIICDQQMPGLSGIELLARAKAVSPDTVRILLTGQSDMAMTARAINEGEVHRFILKPWNRPDLLHHVSLALERNADLRRQRAQALELAEKNDALAELNAGLRRAVQRDGLTGLYNRGEFDLQLERQIKVFQRDRQPFSLLLGDIDDFKRVNDTWGHPAGDQVIRAAAGILLHTLREEMDSAFRYGGEEFAILLRNTTAAAAAVAAGRVLNLVRATRVEAGAAQLSFTLSLGLGQYGGSETAQALLDRVDGALYRAKGEGKDRLHVAPDPAPT
jgi:diguanylate cyclase (GGDEF)-like protein